MCPNVCTSTPPENSGSPYSSNIFPPTPSSAPNPCTQAAQLPALPPVVPQAPYVADPHCASRS
eukprot:2540154-Rhodomonas_salina.2